MEKLNNANKKLKTSHDDREREYKAEIDKLNGKEAGLLKRLAELDKRKVETARESGDPDAAGEDVVEINAGGKFVAVRRSTLTQLGGTRLEALFGGRWDRRLQRDGGGRVFLDVNPVCFQTVVDYLNELAISSEDDPPSHPSVDDEHERILVEQLELFGLGIVENIDSCIIKTAEDVNLLRGWLEEDGSGGEFSLIYRGSREGHDGAQFHAQCDNKGRTLTIIETTCGYVLGGYSNTPWTCTGGWQKAKKAFLFTLRDQHSFGSPCKMKLRNARNNHAVLHASEHGPTFGRRNTFDDFHDLQVSGSNVYTQFGTNYDGRSSHGYFNIKEMEVFQVSVRKSSPALRPLRTERKASANAARVQGFSEKINDAINTKWESLAELEAEIHCLEESFEDEGNFVASFVGGGANDVVSLNVSGTMMATRRSTLRVVKDSVLARQFDDSKWNDRGHKLRVKEWTPDNVASWANNIEDIPPDVGRILKENEIKGRELLALNMEGLKMIGIERAGTLCLLLKEIKALEEASREHVTLVEHSPYCFGKMLDHLRLKQLHAQGLAKEPALPAVCDSQRSRFEKVVKYYFPGDSAKAVLGQ